VGTVKDCKFHTDTSWLCDFKVIEDENDTLTIVDKYKESEDKE
jgi:hypothetical protein